MTIPEPVVTTVAFVVALGVLVFVHELGHFLTAKRIGVKVLRFSIGFGPVLWRRGVARRSMRSPRSRSAAT
jgi:membrane-associated protease RseP (regulator of RpoE activity)